MTTYSISAFIPSLKKNKAEENDSPSTKNKMNMNCIEDKNNETVTQVDTENKEESAPSETPLSIGEQPIVPFPQVSSRSLLESSSEEGIITTEQPSKEEIKGILQNRYSFSSLFPSFNRKTESRDSIISSSERACDDSSKVELCHDVLTEPLQDARDACCDHEAVSSSLEGPTITSADVSKGLKVLFLSSDTGGGHRASAESLGMQFQLQYPGTTYDLLDVMSEDGIYPYNSLVQSYKHLSAHPKQWQIVYGVSNTRAYEMLADVHLKVMCEHAIRKRIKSYNPDVVVSVHPLMTNVPVVSCRKISEESGKLLPMFTVVTDLGSAHCLWFANAVDRMFIASDRIRKLAKERGKVPDEKLVQAGLPIRHSFSLQAEALGDRLSPEGKAYQAQIRESLQLSVDVDTVLVMGGGEGVGCLADIVDSLYVELFTKGMNAQIIVVCGRNDVLRESLACRQWDEVVERHRRGDKGSECFFHLKSSPSTGCLEVTMAANIKKMISTPSFLLTGPPPTDTYSGSESDSGERESTSSPQVENPGNVTVIGLGFVTNMAEYMVAADLLVSKAGPGTIAEAASVGLPVLLTSYLPGQEEGNVDFVIENNFGSFISDSDPSGIGEEVSQWLSNEAQMRSMSEAAMRVGAPNAASDIVKIIGERTLQLRFGA